MEYWLIDVESGNGQGCYDSVDEALRAVASEIQANGGQPIDALGLIAMGGYEGGRELSRGKALVERALRRYPLPNSPS